MVCQKVASGLATTRELSRQPSENETIQRFPQLAIEYTRFARRNAPQHLGTIDPAATMMVKHTSKPMEEAAARKDLKATGMPRHEIDALIVAAKGAKSK
jgi:3-oxoacyl-[acyl-carrier-protein] synthase III